MRPHAFLVSLLTSLLLAACASDPAPEASAGPETDADEGEFVESGDPSLEHLQPNETDLIAKIAVSARDQVSQSFKADAVARRDAHPKPHGCVRASFVVDKSAPSDLAKGTFAPGSHYDAWVRFSNGAQSDDRKSDARGMAIKLVGVGGEKLLPDESTATTHDFVLSNYHTFFIDSLSDYVSFMKTVSSGGNPITFFFSLTNLTFRPVTALRASRFTGQAISSPLTSRYWSVTPYTLGDSGVVKYSARPCGGADTSGKHADDPNFLAKAMKTQLATGDACFDFLVQRRVGQMAIERSTKTWDEDDSPFVKVATITIPKQTFDSDAQATFCENLSFTPWHAPPVHRPLGAVNRTRKVVYQATSSLRHQLNKAARQEPTDLTVPGQP